MFEGEPAGKPLDAGRGRRRREDQRETAGRKEEKEERKEKEGEPAGNRWTQGGEREGGRKEES